MCADPYFRMIAEEIFSIKGRGTVVSGRIESGTLSVRDTIEIRGKDSTRTAIAAAIENYTNRGAPAQAGDRVGVLMREIEKEDVQPGDALTGQG